MGLIIDGEPFSHGLEDEGAALRVATGDPAAPASLPTSHAQNTDVGTSAEFFRLAIGVQPGAGAVRRGLYFNNGGIGPNTAFAWEARDAAGAVTGRFVQCLNVQGQDPKNAANVWSAFDFAPIAANQYGAHPAFDLSREAVVWLLQSQSAATPPVIGGFNPQTGAVGTVVLLNGNNFGTTTGNVKLGTVACTVTGWANNQITLRIPVGGATDKFTVTTAGGVDISRDTFTVTAAVLVGSPAAVSGLAGLPGDQSATLSWTAPTDTGNAPIVDYLVEYRNTELFGSVFQRYRHSANPANSISVTGLGNGVAYEFRVSAINSGGLTGAASVVISVTPARATVVYRATDQTYTTTQADLIQICGSGTTAVPVTATSSDGVSSVGQTEANAIALNRAKQMALAGVVCPFQPGTLSLADESVTNAKLATDVKVGSLSGARNAFPLMVRNALVSVEAFLVYCGGQLTDLATRVKFLEDNRTTGGGAATGTVKSVSVNNAAPIAPDINGNVSLTISTGSNATANAILALVDRVGSNVTVGLSTTDSTKLVFNVKKSGVFVPQHSEFRYNRTTDTVNAPGYVRRDCIASWPLFTDATSLKIRGKSNLEPAYMPYAAITVFVNGTYFSTLTGFVTPDVEQLFNVTGLPVGNKLVEIYEGGQYRVNDTGVIRLIQFTSVTVPLGFTGSVPDVIPANEGVVIFGNSRSVGGTVAINARDSFAAMLRITRHSDIFVTGYAQMQMAPHVVGATAQDSLTVEMAEHLDGYGVKKIVLGPDSFNDCGASVYTPQDIQTGYLQLIPKLQAAIPGAKIFIGCTFAQGTGWGGNNGLGFSLQDYYNAEKAVAANFSNVFTLDFMAAGLVTADYADNTHLLVSGEEKMAAYINTVFNAS